ncbi:MAG: plasmid replication region DNA-binding protein [Methylomarinum sp.]|nr:plasmid replication region DNA-binding protein [Methylomarinum sp.]
MAIRLTEEEVHVACAEIAAQGERPTSLNLLEKIGRGSLTTITKYLNSWNATDDAQAIDAESLPAVVNLPSELLKEGDDLLKKMWNVAKNITDNELDIQREALKQAEVVNQSKVEEAFKFSEAQSMKIERLEEDLVTLKGQFDNEFTKHKETINSLNNSEKENIGLTKDNDQLKQEIIDLKNQVEKLDSLSKKADEEKQALQGSHAKEVTSKEAEIKSLDMQTHKLQTSLDLSVKSNEQLKSELKAKETDLSSRIIELEKVGVRYESSTNELKTIKAELKTTTKTASNAEKMVAKLEGKLEVYKLLETQNKVNKNLEK